MTETDVVTLRESDVIAPDLVATQLRKEFIVAMAANSTSVYVVSTSDQETPLGVTVSAFSGVCADPPTLLVCINTRSPACHAIASNRVFAVSLLSEQQREIADIFAGRATKGRPFDFSCCEWTRGVLGVPLIKGAVAKLECRLVDQHLLGTHRVFFGEVVAVKNADHAPLLYCRRDYGRFQALEPFQDNSLSSSFSAESRQERTG